MGRRGFFFGLTFFLVFFLFPPALVFFTRFPRKRERSVFKLCRVGDIGISPKLFAGKVWAFKENGKLWFLLNRCTHLGCALSFKDGFFRCGCHGSVFTKLGVPVYGPARRPLVKVKAVVQRDGSVVVDISKKGEPVPIHGILEPHKT